MDEEAFSGRLLPGERLVWTGRPAQGILFMRRDAFLVPFSVLWCSFAIFWEFSVMRFGHAEPFFVLFGAAFALIGLGISVGRFFLDAWVRGGTHYAMTDRRILISKPAPFGDFAALSLERLPEARLREAASGRGTIRFGQEVAIFGFGVQGLAIWVPALQTTPQLLAIPDARSVFNLIQRSSARRT